MQVAPSQAVSRPPMPLPFPVPTAGSADPARTWEVLGLQLRAAFAGRRIRCRQGEQDLSSPVAWQTGGLRIIDKHCVAHGREPFAGQRWILVAVGSTGQGAPRQGCT